MYSSVVPCAALCLVCCLVISTQSAAGQGENIIPPWVKQTAGWWSEELISDDEFLVAVGYLIQEGILAADTGGTDTDSMRTGTDSADFVEACRVAEDSVQIITWSLETDNPPFGVNGTYTKWLEALGGQDAAEEAVAAGFDAWVQVNPTLEFRKSAQPSTCGYPHVNVTVGKMPTHTIIGYACLDCLYDEPYMMLDDNWWRITFTSVDVPFDAMSVRNVVAHEFGHILGLEHYYGDPLHLMRVFYAEEVFCTLAGISGDKYYTGLTFDYDDLGWTIPEYLFRLYDDNRPIHPPQHPSSSFFVESAQYDRVSGTLYVEFSQEVLDVYLPGLSIVGNGAETASLRGSEMTYRGNIVEITMPEKRSDRFDDILCAHLEISENVVKRYDTAYMLPQTLIVEVIR